MNNNVIKGLSGLCLLLSLLLLIEWLVTESSEQLEANSNAGAQQQLALTELPKLEIEIKPLESYTQMVESPLFIEGRKPIVEDLTTASNNEEGVEIKDLVLQGIYSVKGEMLVLFNKKGAERKYLKKSAGQDVNGWLLQEIKADRVVLERDGKQQTVMLRKPKPKQLKKTKPARRKALKRPKLNPEN